MILKILASSMLLHSDVFFKHNVLGGLTESEVWGSDRR